MFEQVGRFTTEGKQKWGQIPGKSLKMCSEMQHVMQILNPGLEGQSSLCSLRLASLEPLPREAHQTTQ